MPPQPPWDGMHVLVVHFPIALLFVAPLFVLLGALTGARNVMYCALLLMVLGVIAAFVATNTGEEAMNYAPDPEYFEDEEEDAYVILERHEINTEFARNIFLGLTIAYALLIAVQVLTTPKPDPSATDPTAKKGLSAGLRILLHLAFLSVWCWPMIVLAHAAHDGGRLVHEYHMHARTAESVEREEAAEAEEQDDSEESDEDETEEAA